jgi:copper(I)-binding protein
MTATDPMHKRLLIPLILLALSACSQQATTQVRVENGWVAEIPPVLKVTAALMVLHNDGATSRYLIGATSPATESIEVHKSIVVNDLAKMVRQMELEIPPGGSISFDNQSGYHLMLYGVNGLKAGQSIPITLQFKDGSELTTDFSVLDRRKML